MNKTRVLEMIQTEHAALESLTTLLSETQSPECNAQIPVSEDVHVGEVLICSDCQTQWEVINRDPVEFALAPEIEEDWGE